MPKAFIMITLDTGVNILNVLEEVSKLEGVVEVHEVFHGDFDVIAKAETEDFEDLERLVFDKIRNIHGTRSTMTMVVIE